MSDYVIHCDGLCEPINPRGYACWGVVVLQSGKVIDRACGCVGHGEGMTNNIAEYHALLNALAWAFRHSVSAPIKTDSQLVVQQTVGAWKCNKEELRALRDRCRKGIELTGCTLSWVPREENEIADDLSRQAYANARKEKSYA